MNKTELIASVAQKTELTKKDAEKAVKAVFDTVAQELAAGGKVQVIGFGTFEVRERAAREGRNPQNGKTITIAASMIHQILIKYSISLLEQHHIIVLVLHILWNIPFYVVLVSFL